MLSLEGLLVRYGVEAPGTYALKKWTARDIEATGLEPFVQLQLRTLLGAMCDSERRVKEVETSVKAVIQPVEAYRRVQQVPGIGEVLRTLPGRKLASFVPLSMRIACARTDPPERTSTGFKTSSPEKSIFPKKPRR